jgi:BMFP domain-containing protein YqiC
MTASPHPEGPAMQTDNRILDDLARVAGGALGALTGLKTEFEALFRQQFERILNDMNLVSREEFEAVKAMAAKARGEQEALAARVAELEAKLGVAAKPARKAAAKKPAAARKKSTPPAVPSQR